MPIKLDEQKCKGAGDCVDACPQEVMQKKGNKCVVAKPDECVECGACVDACPNQALSLD